MIDSRRDSYVECNGHWLLTAEALIPDEGDADRWKTGLYGILADDLKVYWERGMGVQIAQIYELVVPGLIRSKHIFCGLRRRLFCDDTENADGAKLVYSRAPAFDVVINRGPSRGNPSVARVPAPRDKTFVVVVSPNTRHRGVYPMIDGWLERWNWVPEDTGLPEAPINWLDRYDKKIFSRG